MSAPRTFVVNIAWHEHVGETGARRLARHTATVELTIDVDSLAFRMGTKAVRSKAKRSRMDSGNIEAKVHSIEVQP